MWEQWIIMIVATICIGCLAGYTAGLFGMGGGVVLVPALLTMFSMVAVEHHIAVKQAVGTSLFLVVPAGVAAVLKQMKMGNIDKDFCKKWIPYTVIGAVLGLFISSLVPSKIVILVFCAYLLLCIIICLSMKDSKIQHARPHGWIRRIGGVVIGAFSVTLGIGGGTLVVPFLKMNKCPMKVALGLSSATTIMLGLVGCVGMIVLGWGVPGRMLYSLGYVNFPVAVVISPFLLWLSPRGVVMSHRLPRRWLNTCYVCFLTIVFGYMIWHVA